MLVPPGRHKRPRSPQSLGSPDRTSPLDVLLKRRRRNRLEPFWGDPSPSRGYPYHHHHHLDSYDIHDGESSETAWSRQAGVERRRTRQWERLNAPPLSVPFPNTSQPNPELQPLSPIPFRRSHSQPEYPNHSRAYGQMSSSPIRHHPPSSSPFRGGAPGGAMVEEWIDAEERRREWGEEYTAQNTLLHDLHRARISSGLPTPDTTLLSTPTLPSPYLDPFGNTHLCVGPTPYRTNPYHASASSSPFPPGEPIGSPMIRDDDETMEMDGSSLGGRNDEMEDEVRKRYEETNRLLRELDVVRRRRWGECG